MQTVQNIKNELAFNTELKQLLDVLKGIAASQFHQLEKRKGRAVKFMEAFEGFFQMIDFSHFEQSWARPQGQPGIIIVTSDEGFMGGLNAKVINAALAYPQAEHAQLITIGEQGAKYLKGRGHTCIEFPGIADEGGYETALKLRNFIMNEALNPDKVPFEASFLIKSLKAKESSYRRFSRLVLFYPKPVTFTFQKIESVTILPCSEMFAQKGNMVPKEDLIVDSSLNKIIEYLLGAWIMEKLLEVFQDSKLSEYAARTLHLEGSHQALLQREKSIRSQYFRARHELVDRGMREIFSVQLIRKKKQV